MALVPTPNAAPVNAPVRALPIVEPVFDLVVVLTPGRVVPVVVPVLTPEPVEVKDVLPTVDVSLGTPVVPALTPVVPVVVPVVVPALTPEPVEVKDVLPTVDVSLGVPVSPVLTPAVPVVVPVVVPALTPEPVDVRVVFGGAVVLAAGRVVEVRPVVLAPVPVVTAGLAPGTVAALAPDRLLATPPGLATVDAPTLGSTPVVRPAIRLVTSALLRTPSAPPPSVSSDVPAIKLPPGRVVEVYPDNASDRSPGLVS